MYPIDNRRLGPQPVGQARPTGATQRGGTQQQRSRPEPSRSSDADSSFGSVLGDIVSDMLDSD